MTAAFARLNTYQGFSLVCAVCYRRIHFKNYTLLWKFCVQDPENVALHGLIGSDRCLKVIPHSFSKSHTNFQTLQDFIHSNKL